MLLVWCCVLYVSFGMFLLAFGILWFFRNAYSDLLCVLICCVVVYCVLIRFALPLLMCGCVDSVLVVCIMCVSALIFCFGILILRG